ncbi:MAG: DUF4382 domain-containing protein [Anaerolineales bacterium]
MSGCSGRRAWAALVWLPVVLLTACSGRAGVGTVEILLSDHREAIGDFDRLTVEIERLELHPASSPPDTGWLVLSPSIVQADLTQLVGDASLLIVTQAVAAQAYDGIRLVLSGAIGILNDGAEIKFDEFSEAGRVEFELADGGTSTLLIDLVVQSRLDHPGEGYLILLGDIKQVAGD